jgi:hypothetical protein
VHVKWQLLNFLYAGVTQVYDIGNIPDVARDTRDMVEAGAWMGPDIKIAGTYFETAEVGAPGYATPWCPAAALQRWSRTMAIACTLRLTAKHHGNAALAIIMLIEH